MANNVQARGLDPEWKQGDAPECAKLLLKSTLDYAIFIGSPFVMQVGYANACSTGSATGAASPEVDGVTGSVVIIYDSAGFPIHNIGTTPAGAKIEGTIEATQRYRMTKVASATAFTQADFGKGGNMTAEAATAGSAVYGSVGSFGDNWSSRQVSATLIAQTDAVDPAKGSQLILLERSPLETGNDFTAAAADGAIELWVKINPLCYVI